MSVATAKAQDQALFAADGIRAEHPTLSPAMLAVLWDRMSQFPILFSTTEETSFAAFRDLIEDRETSLILFKRDGQVEPLGLGMVYDETPGVEAQIQLSFFDRKLKGREQLVRRFVDWAFDEFQVRRLAAHVRADANNFRDFLLRVGLYFEGCKKNWLRRDARLYDLYLYGITRPEADDLWMKGKSWAKPRVRLLKVYEVR